MVRANLRGMPAAKGELVVFHVGWKVGVCTLQLNERETTAGPDAAVVCIIHQHVRPLIMPNMHLHLTVGHRTTGRRRSTGRGATFAALATRAFLLDFFLPGCRGR